MRDYKNENANCQAENVRQKEKIHLPSQKTKIHANFQNSSGVSQSVVGNDRRPIESFDETGRDKWRSWERAFRVLQKNVPLVNSFWFFV